jgi:hypothetical protein
MNIRYQSIDALIHYRPGRISVRAFSVYLPFQQPSSFWQEMPEEATCFSRYLSQAQPLVEYFWAFVPYSLETEARPFGQDPLHRQGSAVVTVEESVPVYRYLHMGLVSNYSFSILMHLDCSWSPGIH